MKKILVFGVEPQLVIHALTSRVLQLDNVLFIPEHTLLCGESSSLQVKQAYNARSAAQICADVHKLAEPFKKVCTGVSADAVLLNAHFVVEDDKGCFHAVQRSAIMDMNPDFFIFLYSNSCKTQDEISNRIQYAFMFSEFANSAGVQTFYIPVERLVKTVSEILEK